MLFNSWQFIFLFSVTAVFYFNSPYRLRMPILLVSSYIFYMYWRWDFAVIMLLVSITNYLAGRFIANEKSRIRKKRCLLLAVAISLVPLFYFKYGDFFLENLNVLLSVSSSEKQFSYLNLVLPVGISFFTFQALSYSLDVYFGKTPVERNFVRFGAFVAFFPQLVAGPIERSSNLLEQLKAPRRFNRNYFLQGSKLFVWGLFKKVVIADRLALYVDKVFESPDAYSGLTLIIATLFFAFQIYCDFSGYSDMAIGAARILGFKLMQNFNLPYFSKSISDFWRRWHISLSSWFGDYLYRPLGGSRVSYIKWIRNILLVFLVSGFWHGAAWTFIIWGGLHAFYYFMESWGDVFLKRVGKVELKKSMVYRIFKVVSVFVSVCYAWIYFRANSLQDAFLITEKIFTDWSQGWFFGGSTVTYVLSWFFIMLLVIVQILQYKGYSSLYFSKSKFHPIIEYGWTVVLLLGISLLGLSSKSFIYFQF